jgi:predicted porin
MALASAGAGLLFSASVARADGVVLYGALDASATYTRSGAPGGNVKGLSSGILNSSYWGLRGEEDLGDGLRASFTLEAGLDVDTGAAKSYNGNPSTATPTAPNGTAGTGFNRRSSISLSNSWGSVSLGRDYAPVFWAALETDPSRLGMYGNVQSTVPITGGSERWARLSNGVFYRSPNLAGAVFRVAYSFGSESNGSGGSPPSHANEFLGLGVVYTRSNLTATASYQELKIPLVAGTPLAFTGETSRKKDALVGAKYTFTNANVSGGYWKVGTPQSGSVAWLGGSYFFGTSQIVGQVQQMRQDNAFGAEKRGTQLSLGYLYNLSKRTATYVSYGRINNNATGAFSLLSSDTAVAASGPGYSPSGLAFGVRHFF